MSKKFIFIIPFLLFFSLSFIYAFNYFYGIGHDTNTAIANINDTYVLDDQNGVRLDVFSKSSNEYNEGYRIKLTQVDDTGSGFIQSEQYGSFYIKDKILGQLDMDNTFLRHCLSGETIAYSLTGTLTNPDWGVDMIINNSSFYCPASKILSLTMYSLEFGLITIISPGDLDILDGVSNSEIFDTKKVAISGVVSSDKITGADTEITILTGSTTGYQDFVKTDYGVEGKISNVNSYVNKNISKITAGLTPITTNASNLDGFGLSTDKSLYYYDFTGNFGTLSNEENEGMVLTIGNNGPSGSGKDFFKIPVRGSKTLIVKGGNIYINADIYNASSNSLLVIVVKRDETNNKNGGNIYINPEVTNIDAVLIADGSILSYNGSNVLTSVTDPDVLRKQLLIYGSIMTKNTIGDDKVPYGSDKYILGGANETTTDKKYNLEYLRSFSPMQSEYVESGSCSGKDNDLVAVGDTSTGATMYAFAGKRKCYFSDPVQSNLRGTDRLASLVIEYNPIMQLNPPKILQKDF